MKKMLLAVLLCLALAVPALGEDAVQAPTITAPYDAGDDRPGLIISSPEGDKAVRLLGVEGEAVPCGWQTFSQIFTRFMKTNFDFSPAFTGPYFSDGYWTRVMTDGADVVLVRCAGPEEEANIGEIRIHGDMDTVGDMAVLSAACMFSAAHCGQMGQYAMNLLFYGQGIDEYVVKGCDYWRENGFQLSFGSNFFLVPWGRITYADAAPQAFRDAYSDAFMNNGPSLEAFSSYLRTHADILGLEPPEIPDPWPDESGEKGAYMAGFEWEDCAVALSCRPDEADGGMRVASVAVVSTTGDTVSLWGRAALLYAAAVQASEKELFALMMLSGGSADWDTLCEMKPYCFYRNAALQCMNDGAMNGMLYAVISGAEQKEP